MRHFKANAEKLAHTPGSISSRPHAAPLSLAAGDRTGVYDRVRCGS